jgi:hypothetical protein
MYFAAGGFTWMKLRGEVPEERIESSRGDLF